MPGGNGDTVTNVGRGVAALILVVALYTYWPSSKPHGITIEELLKDVYEPPHLVDLGKNLSDARIIEVTEGVYMGFGYAFGNVILLDAPEGIVVVDTTEAQSAARRILADFRKINQKPIKAIVFSHHHVDHIYGAVAFLNESKEDQQIDIWAYESFERSSLDEVRTYPRCMRGAVYQFGIPLGKKRLTCGAGACFEFDHRVTIFPNKIITGDRMDVNIAGLNLTFIHIPGEAQDEVAVWLPEKRVLLPSDGVYRSLPSLYPIRGLAPRNILNWLRSLRKMRDLGAKYLLPTHTEPVEGEDKIYEVFTVFMAGMQYIHDQTIRYLNKGLHPDDIITKIQLPTNLATHEYAWQHYGHIVLNIKAVYYYYVGWFTGDAVELLPNSPVQRSTLMVDFIGADRLLSEAEAVLKEGINLQWALELVSYVFRAQPQNTRAREIRWWIMRELAGLQTNPLARNFYLTEGLKDHGLIDFDNISTLLEGFDMFKLLTLLTHRLKSEEVADVNTTIILCITDTAEAFKLQIEYSVFGADRLPSCPGTDLPKPTKGTTGGRRGPQRVSQMSVNDGDLFTSQIPDQYDAKIISSLETWKSITSKVLDPATAHKTGAVEVTGSVQKFIKFLSYIE